MPSGPLFLPSAAAAFQFRVKVVVARRLRDRHHEVCPRVLDQPFDLSLVIALAGAPEAIGEQVVADQSGEGLGALALAVTADLRDRDLRVMGWTPPVFQAPWVFNQQGGRR